MVCLSIGYALFALQPLQAQNKPLKFAYINSAFIFEKYEGKKDVQEKYDKIILGWQGQLEVAQSEIEDLRTQLEECTMCSDARKQELQQQIQQKSAEAEQFYMEKFGYGGEAYQLNAKMTNPIIKEILEVVTEIGNSENYTMIFDAVDGGIVYAPEELDMSEQVVQKMNENVTSGGGSE